MRQTFVMRDGQLIPKHLARPRESKRSSLPSPMLIRDSMDPIQGQMDGQLYDSKSTYRRALRDAGCVEIGNEPVNASAPNFDAVAAEVDVKEAMQQLGMD